MSFTPKLSEKVDPKQDALAIDKIITARIGLLIRAPFFGNMVTRLIIKNSSDWCATAATDGRHFYYNTDFINALTIKEVEFLFGHELLHSVYSHMDRGTGRDHQLFNVACDYVVNADLIDQRIGERIKTVPLLYDAKYKGMCAEEVYDILYEQAEKIDVSGLMSQLLDDHLDGGDDDDGNDGVGEEGNKDIKRKGKGRPKLTEEEKKQIRDDVREAMISAAQVVGAGNTPGGVKRMLADLLEPKMNWRELLQQQVQSLLKVDTTWLRPSRRAWHSDAIMPGAKPGETIDIAVAIDTSGSISQSMLKEFLSEIKGIMDAFAEYKISLWTFDTRVYNMQEFTQENSDELLNYDIQGGGGTDFMCNWTFMQENEILPKKLVFFTDLCPFGEWGIEGYCDTIWIAHGTDAVAPWGVTCRYDEGK